MKQKKLEIEVQSGKQVDFKTVSASVFCEGKRCFRVAPTSHKYNKKGEGEQCTRESFIERLQKERMFHKIQGVT